MSSKQQSTSYIRTFDFLINPIHPKLNRNRDAMQCKLAGGADVAIE